MSAPLPLARAGVPDAAHVLARALADDPGWTYVFPAPATRIPRMTRLLATMLERVYAPLGTSWVVPGAAAAIATPPGRHDLPLAAILPAAPGLAALVGRRIPHGVRVLRAMARGTPREPHWYLALLGVDPAHQGRGLGGRVLAPLLDAAADTRTLLWLESTNPANHGFYRRAGFELADRTAVPGGPTVSFFARRPR